MEYRLSKFKNDIANQFGHNVFYNNVLLRVFYYLLEKHINTLFKAVICNPDHVIVPTVTSIKKILPTILDLGHTILSYLMSTITLRKTIFIECYIPIVINFSPASDLFLFSRFI